MRVLLFLVLASCAANVCLAVHMTDLVHAVSEEADEASKRSRVLDADLKMVDQTERARVREIVQTRWKRFKSNLTSTTHETRLLVSAETLAKLVCCDGLNTAAAFVRATARHTEMDFASVLYACQQAALQNVTSSIPQVVRRWPPWQLFVEAITSDQGNLLLSCASLPSELLHLRLIHPSLLEAIPDSAEYAHSKAISKSAKRHHGDLVLLHSSLEKRPNARIDYGINNRLRQLEGKCVEASGKDFDLTDAVVVCPYRFVRIGSVTSIFDAAVAKGSSIVTTFADVRYVTPCKSEIGTPHITTVTFLCPTASEGVFVVGRARCSLQIEFHSEFMC